MPNLLLGSAVKEQVSDVASVNDVGYRRGMKEPRRSAPAWGPVGTDHFQADTAGLFSRGHDETPIAPEEVAST
jgi:hypothetical protein